jgi:hypothetical protein
MRTVKEILSQNSKELVVTKSQEDSMLDDLVKDFGNGSDKTKKNLHFLVSYASKENKLDQVNKIRAEVKADSNSGTRSMTAVFISRCLKELEIKGSGENFSSIEKWLFKVLHATEDDLLCNTDLFFELGRYEKKTVNRVEKVFNNDKSSYFKIAF